MKRLTYFRIIILSIAGALILSLISLYCLVRISDNVIDDYRYTYLLYMAKRVEKVVKIRPITQVSLARYLVPPEAPNDTLSLLEASTEFASNQGQKQSPSLWIVNKAGRVLSSNSPGSQLPMEWEDFPAPKKVHGITSTRMRLLEPKTFIMRLNTVPTMFLVSFNPKSLFHGPFLWLQGIHTFTTAAMAVFLAITISFFYLQKKSSSARKVMAQLETGDLKARFEVKRFDEFGSLILDFNRMADEIEKLVVKVKNTESSRSNLLQELGHDIRTPLTSLRTTFETFRDYNNVMSEGEKKEVFQMVAADISYFQDLLEKLTIVATIDVPHYKINADKVDLVHLIQHEISNRRTSSALEWSFTAIDEAAYLKGDPHLLLRLFKNAFDNASRFATQAVNVSIKSYHDHIEVLVVDDGPGLTPEGLNSFGKRRERRQVKERDSESFSLGLGSVIMKAIACAHDGLVIIENRIDKNISGACVTISFKRT